MKVAKVMKIGIKCARMDDTLEKIMHEMKQLDTHHILVVDEGKLKGIISDRDIKRFVSPFVGTAAESTKDASTLTLKAHQIMTRNPHVVSPETDVRHAMDLMLEHKINALPVVDAERNLKGILTTKDIMNAFMRVIDIFD